MQLLKTFVFLGCFLGNTTSVAEKYFQVFSWSLGTNDVVENYRGLLMTTHKLLQNVSERNKLKASFHHWTKTVLFQGYDVISSILVRLHGLENTIKQQEEINQELTQQLDEQKRINTQQAEELHEERKKNENQDKIIKVNQEQHNSCAFV